jgi:AcrR family transcriptional regulator
MAAPRDTRARIIAAAMELFAARGYSGTSIGEIEAAAGLAPRSGGLYKHFASKEELLEAALSERIAEIDAFNARLELEPLGDLRAELILVARWGLAELARERQLIRIVMRDGGRVPELAERFHATVVRRGTDLAARTLERYAAERGIRVPDPEALGEVLCASLVGFNLQQVMFGDGFADVDADRFAAAWVDTCVAIIETLERSQVHA